MRFCASRCLVVSACLRPPRISMSQATPRKIADTTLQNLHHAIETLGGCGEGPHIVRPRRQCKANSSSLKPKPKHSSSLKTHGAPRASLSKADVRPRRPFLPVAVGQINPDDRRSLTKAKMINFRSPQTAMACHSVARSMVPRNSANDSEHCQVFRKPFMNGSTSHETSKPTSFTRSWAVNRA